MKKLNIVLVAPEIPQNTGNIARTCACTGAALHLVEPLGFKVDDKRLKRAGLDYWHLLDISYYPSFDAFIETVSGKHFFLCTTKAQNTYSDIRYPEGSYLIFGRETAGLPEEVLQKYPEKCIRIPMIEGARSLNLSNSVAIIAYEALRQNNFQGLKAQGEPTSFCWD